MARLLRIGYSPGNLLQDMVISVSPKSSFNALSSSKLKNSEVNRRAKLERPADFRQQSTTQRTKRKLPLQLSAVSSHMRPGCAVILAGEAVTMSIPSGEPCILKRVKVFPETLITHTEGLRCPQSGHALPLADPPSKSIRGPMSD